MKRWRRVLRALGWPGVSGLVFAAAFLGTCFWVIVADQGATSGHSVASSAPDTAWTPVHAIYAAKLLCQKVGASELKAPASARWADLESDYGEQTRPGHYVVALTVDAQNSFGALLRAVVRCTVTRTGDHFQITSLRVVER